MKIEFYLQEQIPKISQERKDEVRNFVQNKVSQIVNDLGTDISILDKIVFADKERYSEAISSIDENEDYTNNEYGAGFGKTIMQNEKSSIIYRLEILNAIVTIGNKTNLSKDEELPYYVFRHEIGHAIDNSLRKPKKLKSEETFDERRISHFYIEILISEFAANWNSAKQLSKVYFDDLVSSKVDNVKNRLEDIKSIKAEMGYTLAQRKYGIADRIWLNLMEIAQLLGVSILRNFNFTFPESLIEKSMQKKIKNVFIQIGETYPMIKEESKEELYFIWEEIYKKEHEI